MRNNSRAREWVLWSATGAWFCQVDYNGRERSSFLGFITSKRALQGWCAQHGFEFEEVRERVKAASAGL